MDYPEIKKKITQTVSDLLCVVNAREHDYTHQPSEETLVSNIKFAIDELEELVELISEKDV